MVEIITEEVKADQERKKALVSKAVASHCSQNSEHADLRAIGEALEQGDELKCVVLTGGLTNYSYKVSLQKDPTKCLYAKLSFPYALWNPQREHFDVARTETEFQMMKTFDSISPGHVAKPYLCLDIEDMKLMVTEWSKSDEQFSNQFIDGAVDPRTAEHLAKSVAKLHCVEGFPADFNETVRPGIIDYWRQIVHTHLDEIFDEQNPVEQERAIELIQSVGKDYWLANIERLIGNLNTTGHLLHNDLHTFNLLTENKPSTSLEDAQFGPEGSIVLCDWEMAFMGPIGKDIGTFLQFPICCAVAHAYNGQLDVATGILDYLDTFVDDYIKALLKEKNLTDPKEQEALVREIVLESILWSGAFMSAAQYIVRAHLEYLPFDDCPAAVHESIGVISYKFLLLGDTSDATGFDVTDMGSSEIRSLFRKLAEDEITTLASVGRPTKRRSSVLRTSGRRVSDAGLSFMDTELTEGTEAAGRKLTQRTSMLLSVLAELDIEDYE